MRLKDSAILIIIITVFFAGSSFAVAQTDDERIEELRRQIAELEKQAEQFRGNIASEKARAHSLARDIAVLQGQIGNIQTKISITNTQIDKTQIEIGSTEDGIIKAQDKIDRQKSAVTQLLISIQRRDSESLLASLMKNENISDFLRQAEYTADINNSLLTLINDLKISKNELESFKSSLVVKKTDLEQYNQQNRIQQLSLSEVKGGKDKLLKDTKGQEAQYQKMLKEVEQKKALFFTELRELETKVIQGGLYIVHIVADPAPPKGKIFQWPEKNYKITQGYGITSYSRSGAYGGAGHNGIDMAAGYGSEIMAIGDGEIVANGSNSGWGNWVAVKHDNSMVSVYGHMSSLSFLRVGTRVKVGDVIGFEGSTGNSTGSHLHLSLYKEFFTYVNEKNGQLYFNYFDGSVNPLNYL